jgi:hypothetical protein
MSPNSDVNFTNITIQTFYKEASPDYDGISRGNNRNTLSVQVMFQNKSIFSHKNAHLIDCNYQIVCILFSWGLWRFVNNLAIFHLIDYNHHIECVWLSWVLWKTVYYSAIPLYIASPLFAGHPSTEWLSINLISFSFSIKLYHPYEVLCISICSVASLASGLTVSFSSVAFFREACDHPSGDYLFC